MGKLTYTAIVSLDGYTEDQGGSFGWAEPSDELHLFFNTLEAENRRILCGRRLYEVMSWWDDEENWIPGSETIRDYGRIWKSIPKVVYSRNPGTVTGPRAEVRTVFDPEEILRWKAEAPGPMSIGGADLGGQALEAGLVDEVILALFPIILGGGKPALPKGWSSRLTLTDTRTIGGVVLVRYTTSDA